MSSAIKENYAHRSPARTKILDCKLIRAEEGTYGTRFCY